ncbi:hypothetical protein AEAC466_09245 [Asticcacaulis sp. AC466]|uniref:hypothetical protein n=1 Tax=Asticcacaulis sp. AC466 TaxID=1282362 RepID=UPI0003C3C0D4|nr:hypothetical protein [Asticcacaulis sp. AC466]ESQ84527.1 hypothetical protein AEAC466_09245 [Asticcacaulis sp. AC466]
MSEDALKALLMADEPATPLARDLSFTIEVMQKVERRRLIENIALCTGACAALAVLLYIVMPHVTPGLITLGQAATPAVIMLACLAMAAFGLYQIRPALREFGIRL